MVYLLKHLHTRHFYRDGQSPTDCIGAATQIPSFAAAEAIRDLFMFPDRWETIPLPGSSADRPVTYRRERI